MKNIILLMCGRNKLCYKAKARNLYTSPRFQKSLKYAKTLTNEANIFILSAKYGLLQLDSEIEPYEKSIYEMSVTENEKWAENVVSKLKLCTDIEKDNFIFFTDNDYCRNILKYLGNVELPLKELDETEHLKWFEKQIEGEKL